MEVINIISAYCLDLWVGDPEDFPHPVRLMGKVIGFLDNRLNPDFAIGFEENGLTSCQDKACEQKNRRRIQCNTARTLLRAQRSHGKKLETFYQNPIANSGLNKRAHSKWGERLNGAIAALATVGISVTLAGLLIKAARGVNPWLGNLVCIYLGYTTLSIKDLMVKAKAVRRDLQAGSLSAARHNLSRIVGRDTRELSEEQIIKATVESIAESANDGIVAPLFYLVLGGPVLAMAYKAVNTLDSMLGYKNEKYLHFGWFSARWDDLANFLPARISGLLIPLSAFILGRGFSASFRTMRKDGRKYLSPNSGISEAAMAGALGIKLGGPAAYQGEIEDKPYLGEDKRPVRLVLIEEALRISFMTSLLMLILGVLWKWLVLR